MEWLQANWLPLLIVVLIVLGFIGWIVYLCKKKGLRTIALNAILEAEKELASADGAEKMAAAIAYFYNLLPVYIRALMPLDMVRGFIERFIQKIFDEVKELLDYQKPIEGGTK